MTQAGPRAGRADGFQRLSGPGYERSNQADATCDDEAAGRWVAVDESGWDGEQLYARADRFLSIGSVAIDDQDAAPIVAQLRQDGALRQPPELKFAQFAAQRSGSRLRALAALLASDGALGGRVSIYLIDKHWFVAAKIIDLLLEEEAHARGINLYEGNHAQRLAATLFHDGPRALGPDGFDRLIAAMVGFASRRNRAGAVVTVDALFEEFRRALARSHRRKVTDILSALLQTRVHAEDFLRELGNDELLPAMEPLIPALPAIGHWWSRQIGGMSMLVDEHRVLTDYALGIVASRAALDVKLWGPDMGAFRRLQSQAVRAVRRGVSREHPSIQLADLIAGAGQAVARRHAGAPSPAGDLLVASVVPLINEESMVPYDSVRASPK